MEEEMGKDAKEQEVNGRKAAEGDVRSRGRGFPVTPLAEAVKVLKEAGKYGTDHAMSAFAGYMGYGSINGGAFKRSFASYRDWRLVTSDGTKVRMTELGKRIALPPDPDKEQGD